MYAIYYDIILSPYLHCISMQRMYIVLYLHLVKCYVKKQYRIDMFGSSAVMISHLIVLSLSNKPARTREHTSI